MAEIGFDLQSQGIMSGDVQSADVRGPGGSNAFPAVMRSKLIGETARKVVCLSDIYRVPIAIDRTATEDIDTGPLQINYRNRMQLELVSTEACSNPDNDRSRVD